MTRTLFSFGAALVIASQACALSIGYFDSTRESFGFSGGGPYLGNAKQWLADQGHTLLATNTASGEFLGGVGAFYVGLLNSVTADELAAMTTFVDEGGFLFLQADHAGTPAPTWGPSATALLANWGFVHQNDYSTFGQDYQIAPDGTPWVPDSGQVPGFHGDRHSVITAAPDGSMVLATDDQGRTVLAVLEIGSKGGAVIVANDINFWNNVDGWMDARNRSLWATLWQNAAARHDSANRVPETGATALLLATSLLGLAAFGRSRRTR